MQGMRTMGLAILVLGAVLTVVAVAEDVTVSTYYPSPKGVYQQLSTTGNTFLATQPGSNVGVGTNAPAFTLDVNGTIGSSGLATLNGITMPNGNFTVSNGNATVSGTLNVTGAATVGPLTAGNTTVGTLNAGATTLGATSVTGFRMGGATANYVLKATNVAGDAAWQPAYAVYQ
ncbi:MAG: hypothetical protein HY599_02915 [Candidatus Omnitrophica bacterium]|nr:hypothetical protein [Candidatus Omnitrophota bacterium]